MHGDIDMDCAFNAADLDFLKNFKANIIKADSEARWKPGHKAEQLVLLDVDGINGVGLDLVFVHQLYCFFFTETTIGVAYF